MKILYAANDSVSSYLQLKRFLSAAPPNTEIRVSGYRRSLREINADYCLDAIIQNDDNHVNYYIEEVKIYSPDLIISDMDFLTSFAAVECGIPFWVVSSSMLYEAVDDIYRREAIPLYKYYRAIFKEKRETVKINYQIHNAERKLVYSHLGDIPMRPILREGFEWVRPYYVKAIENYESPTFICNLYDSDKSIIKYVSQLSDVSLFSPLKFETYDGIDHYDSNDPIYARKIANAYLFFCQGETSLIADAFYNRKYVFLFQDFNNMDSLINYVVADHYSYGQKVFSKKTLEPVLDLLDKKIEVDISLNKQVKFLDEYIKELE
jgi:hypothetical protein